MFRFDRPWFWLGQTRSTMRSTMSAKSRVGNFGGTPRSSRIETLVRRHHAAVFEFGMNWNAVANKPEQALAARTSIEAAAWCLLTSVAIRELLGVPPKFPTRDFADIVERIIDRL